MAKMKMERDFTVRTTVGPCLGFKKGKETAVPPNLVAECTKYGAVLCEGEEAPKMPKTDAKPEASKEEREVAILNAIESMFMKNERESFTGSGLPEKKALEAEVGFKVDVKERDALWRKFEKSKKPADSNFD